ncbi:hypothetical protein C8F01DRAFT_1092460 [Mycena amicta]|nr:hypothetical protein C8F01DRAFT_1092460 [Mycena amicta]
MSPSMTPEQRQTQITRKEGLPKRYTKNPKQSIRPMPCSIQRHSFVKVQSVIEHQTVRLRIANQFMKCTHYKVVFDKSYGNQNTYTVPADLVFGVPPWGTEVKKMKVTPITEARDKGKKREVSPSGVAAQPPRRNTDFKLALTLPSQEQSLLKTSRTQYQNLNHEAMVSALCVLYGLLNSSRCVCLTTANYGITDSKAVRMHVINPLSEDDTATAARSFISDVKNALFLCVTCHRKMDGNAQSPASFFFCPPLFILEWILHEWIDDQQKPMADAIREAFPSGLHHYHVIPQMDYFNLHLPPPSVDLTGQEWSPKKMDRDAKTAGPLLWDLEIVGIEHMLTALFWRFDDIIAMDVPKDKWYHQLLGVLIQIRHKLIQGAYDRAPEEQGPTGPASGNPSTGPQPGPPDSRDPPPGPPAPRDPSPGPSAPRDPPPTASGAAPDRAHDRDRHGSPTIWRVGGPQWWSGLRLIFALRQSNVSNKILPLAITSRATTRRETEESDNEESDGASLPSVPTVDIPSWLSEVPQGEQCEDEHPGYAQQWQEHAHDGHRLTKVIVGFSSGALGVSAGVLAGDTSISSYESSARRRDETIVQIVARQFENSSSLFGAYGWEGTADKLGVAPLVSVALKTTQTKLTVVRCVSERQNAMLVDNDRVAVSCRLELPRSGTLRSALSRSFLDNLEENPELLLGLCRTGGEEVADDIQGGQIVAFESS